MQIIMCWITLYKKYNAGKYIRINAPEIMSKNEKNSDKKFRWNEVFLSVQSRILFPCKKHFINKALKLSTALL